MCEITINDERGTINETLSEALPLVSLIQGDNSFESLVDAIKTENGKVKTEN